MSQAEKAPIIKADIDLSLNLLVDKPILPEDPEKVGEEPFIPNAQSRCLTAADMKVRPNVDLFDIRNPRLQHIFNKETDDLEKSFADMKMQIDPILYKYEVMLCFWFSIYKESLYECQLLYTLDPICIQIMKNLRGKGEPILTAKREAENSKKKKKDMFSMISISGSQDVSGLNHSHDEFAKSNQVLIENMDDDEDMFVAKTPMSNEFINKDGSKHEHPVSPIIKEEPKEDPDQWNFKDAEDMKEIKWLL